MRAMRIDFATPSVRRVLFHTHPLVWALSVLAAIALAGAITMAWSLNVAERAHQARMAALQRVPAPAASAAADAAKPAIPDAQAHAVNAVIMQLNLPWRGVQDAIASATTPNIALLALEPDARRRSIKLTAEAKNSDDMIAYIEQLKQQELFTSVNLLRHELNDQDANHPIRFQLEAQWSRP